jgi:hypothetical protein
VYLTSIPRQKLHSVNICYFSVLLVRNKRRHPFMGLGCTVLSSFLMCAHLVNVCENDLAPGAPRTTMNKNFIESNQPFFGSLTFSRSLHFALSLVFSPTLLVQKMEASPVIFRAHTAKKSLKVFSKRGLSTHLYRLKKIPTYKKIQMYSVSRPRCADQLWCAVLPGRGFLGN